VVHLVSAPRVLQPIGEVGEVSRTIIAFERAHSCVYVGVLFQLRIADEALVAHSAREWSLLKMHQVVDLETALRFVHLAALFATIGTRLRMVLLVALQM